jgi:hypothetical protein
VELPQNSSSFNIHNCGVIIKQGTIMLTLFHFGIYRKEIVNCSSDAVQGAGAAVTYVLL